MKIIERHAYYIVLAKPISQATIAEARFEFTGQFGGRNPRKLRVGSKALNDMCAEIGVDKIPAVFTNESVQGLLIERAPELQPDEWLVGTDDERIRNVKA